METRSRCVSTAGRPSAPGILPELGLILAMRDTGSSGTEEECKHPPSVLDLSSRSRHVQRKGVTSDRSSQLLFGSG
jgi:hypothetical protein